MKTLLIPFLTSLMLFVCASCAHSQSDEKQVVASLNNFYNAYNKAWVRKGAPTVLIAELDSLYRIYCTESLRTELKKLLHNQGLDHDIFTNDYGTNDESMKTLTITKDSTKVDGYIVSYFIITEDPSNKKVKANVIIHLSIKKENGNYKINEVK